MNHPATLTLGFSSMGDRLPALLPLLDRLRDLAEVDILVVVQCWQHQHKQLVEAYQHVRFIWSDTLGLSRSRNIAIQQSESDFFWLLDDDVDIKPSQITELRRYLADLPERYQILRVRVGCLENPLQLYKSYSDKVKFTPLMALQMNSIELIIRRSWVIAQGVRFNPNIGLGTPLPGAEEIHFLLDARECGAEVQLLNKVFIYHSCCEGGRQKPQTDAMMEIRGATASRFGLLGAALMLRWCARYFIEYRRIGVVTSMLKGFFNGYDYYR